jgi:prevent-host-death family protein
MRETTLTDFRSHAKSYFDQVEKGETVRVYRNGRPIADVVPVAAHTPAWRSPPEVRLSLAGLRLSHEILIDREDGR